MSHGELIESYRARRTMRTARMHVVGAPLRIDEVPVPQPGPTDVVVAVEACNVVPNLKNVLTHWTTWHPELTLPPLPGSFGLDATGVLVAVGTDVHAIKPGCRVYVNPASACGGCVACRRSNPLNCISFTFRGYFGRGPAVRSIFERYPHGGLSEFILAPQSSLVMLPDNVPSRPAARFGYLGTAYGALRRADFRPGETLLINGIGGTLGVNTVMIALAMGASRIFGTGRRAGPLERVKALAPQRIEVLSVEEAGASMRDWVHALTEGFGVDVVLDALPPGSSGESSMAAIRALRRGGRAVNPGGMDEALTLDPFWCAATNGQLIGARWFSVADGEDMAAMAAAGTLDLTLLEETAFGLEAVNDAVDAAAASTSGFANFVVVP